MKTILVVDDEFDLTGTLRTILEGEGYCTETCTNGRQALERLQAQKPDLLLMDVMMPFLSGYDVVETMKQSPDLDGIPVILMSSVPPRKRQGAHHWKAFLRKPFSLDLLLKTVEEVIGAPGPS